MRIRLTAAESVLDATLDDNATARDFASLLPLTLQMNDLFKREKYGHLSRSLAAGGKPRSSYEIGNIAYWSPAPGIVSLGQITSGADAFKQYDGTVDVTIEAVD